MVLHLKQLQATLLYCLDDPSRLLLAVLVLLFFALYGLWQLQPKFAQIYVCITTYEPGTESNPNPNSNPNPTTKRHAILNIHLDIITCPTYPEKFMRDNVVAPSGRL